MSGAFDVDERTELLIKLGNEVWEAMSDLHKEAGGEVGEIVFLPEKVKPLVLDYSNYLEAYRAEHIEAGKFVAGDKIAAFTGMLIMRHEPFESSTGRITSRYSDSANATFAVRVSELFTQSSKAGFNPPRKKQFLRCFALCNEHDMAMQTWTTASMTSHLNMGSTKEEQFFD